MAFEARRGENQLGFLFLGRVAVGLSYECEQSDNGGGHSFVVQRVLWPYCT